MREWREEVRLGMMRLLSAWSRVPGRPSRSPVRGRWKEEWVFREGAILSFAAVRLYAKLSVGLVSETTVGPLLIWGTFVVVEAYKHEAW